MDIKEKALLYRAHAGDRGAAGTLYEHYYRDIYSYIFYRVNHPSTAEDLSAEVFVRMIRHLPGFLDQGKPFISWLYSLAKKVIRDYKENSQELISARNIFRCNQTQKTGSFFSSNSVNFNYFCKWHS